MTIETPDYARMARDVVVSLAGCCDCDKLPAGNDRAKVWEHGRTAKHFVWCTAMPMPEKAE